MAFTDREIMLQHTDLLGEGERVFLLDTDDNHTFAKAFRGWLQVKAKKLDYPTVFNALKKGDFYSSSGPVIKSLYVEDNTVLRIYCIGC